jgi:NADH-quinone oxidoreductase subunit M
MGLVTIVIVGLASPLLVLGLGWKRPRLRRALAFLALLYPLSALAALYGRTASVVYARLPFLGIDLSLRITPLAWLFGIATAAIGILALVYSYVYMREKRQLDLYCFLFLLVHAGMIGVVLSGDFITFYILWEIMSVATFLMVSLPGRESSQRAGLTYILFSIGGSGAMLLAILSLYTVYGTVDMASLAGQLAGASPGYALSILLLFSVAFGIKNALIPFHSWLPGAYAESHTPFSAVLSGMLTRMGIYGFLLSMYVLLGVPLLGRLHHGPVGYQIVLAWIAGVTILIGVFAALLHDDAKRLISWSSIGHGGYMVLGLALTGPLTMTGGIFHVIAYAMSVSLLFLALGAVEYRTGTRDLTRLGGLASKMPVTFAAATIAVVSMIGLPLTSGFVSKWLIYKGLISGDHPFLAFVALLGTWGTILYGYKFVHGAFLGRASAEYAQVEEVPWGMRAPMIVLSGLILLFGILPGIPLKAIGLIESQFGITPLQTALFGVPREIGELNLMNILGGILAAAFLMYLIFSPTAKARRAGELDTYTAGSPTPTSRYNHAARFYDPLQKIIEPYLADRFSSLYSWIGEQVKSLSETTRKLYSGDINTYALWIVLLLGVLFTMGLLGWKP